MQNEIKHKTIHAVKWNLLSQFLNQFLVICFNIIMLRYLLPYDVGLYAIPLVIYSLFRMIQDFGLSEAFIKDNSDSIEYYSTLFWFIIASGFVCSIISYIISPIIPFWSGFNESITINRHLSMALLTGILFVPIDLMFRKQLDFRSAFLIELFSNIISGVVGILLVVNEYKWASLSLKMVTYTSCLSLLSLLFMKVKPIFVFNKQYIVRNTNFAIPNITDQLLNFFYRNLDTLLIGKYIGSTALGLYDRSYKFLMLPMQQVVTAFSKVMLPSFSNFKDRQDILISGYIKVIKIISWIVFPMMLTIFILSDLIVVLLFGEQWREMIPLLKVFSILGAVQSISSLSSYVFYLKDKVWLLLRYSIISKSIYFILLLFAVFLFKDIFHIVLAISFTSLIITLPFWYIVTKTLGTDILNLIKAILPQLGISLILASILYLLKSYIIKYNTGIFALILLLLLAIVFYWLINIISNNKTYFEIKEKIFDMITT